MFLLRNWVQTENKKLKNIMRVYIEKTINELGDKVTEDQKQKVNEAKEELSKALEGDDIEKIKEKMKALDSALHEISTAIYQQQAQAQQGEQQGQASGVNDDNVVDAEYTEAPASLTIK